MKKIAITLGAAALAIGSLAWAAPTNSSVRVSGTITNMGQDTIHATYLATNSIPDLLVPGEKGEYDFMVTPGSSVSMHYISQNNRVGCTYTFQVDSEGNTSIKTHQGAEDSCYIQPVSVENHQYNLSMDIAATS